MEFFEVYDLFRRGGKGLKDGVDRGEVVKHLGYLSLLVSYYYLIFKKSATRFHRNFIFFGPSTLALLCVR